MAVKLELRLLVASLGNVVFSRHEIDAKHLVWFREFDGKHVLNAPDG